MSRNVKNEILNFHRVSGRTKRFEANLSGVSALKRGVHGRAREFLYLRKGEDFGAFIEFMVEAAKRPKIEVVRIMRPFFACHTKLGNPVSLEALGDLDPRQWLEFYKIVTRSVELLIPTVAWMAAMIRSSQQIPPLPDIRVICNPSDVTEEARRGFEHIQGSQVRHYNDPAQAGTHRFYVSEKEYCFFVRRPDKRFFGFTGKDPGVISELKTMFLKEWRSRSTHKPEPFPR
jgi:hypothetical protein